MATQWPFWWEWELRFSAHLFKRMLDRGFNEIDLRRMLQWAESLQPDFMEGRWIVKTRHRKRKWEVVVEPDVDARMLVVVTAYPVVR